MKNYYYKAFFALGFLTLIPAVSQAEPLNLDIYIQQLEHYHDAGEYSHDMWSVIGRARHYLYQRALKNSKSQHPKKLAIVLDIDETSLSNYAYLAAHHLIVGPEIAAFQAKATDPVLLPTFKLYQDAIADHIAVFFITGRSEDERAATIANLQKAGYRNWDALYMRPDSYHQDSIVPFKSSIRKGIEAKGYDIVANVGDQFSDLAGGYADQRFKIPNPFYFIP